MSERPVFVPPDLLRSQDIEWNLPAPVRVPVDTLVTLVTRLLPTMEVSVVSDVIVQLATALVSVDEELKTEREISRHAFAVMHSAHVTTQRSLESLRARITQLRSEGRPR